MKLEFKKIEKKDYRKAVQYAIKGMNFDRYLNNKILLNLYGRCFWYLEIARATHIIAAYDRKDLVGVLLAEIKGHNKIHSSIWQKFRANFFKLIENILFRKGSVAYEKANELLLNHYLSKNDPDGEINFLATNPESKIKGVGSQLLKELERDLQGREIYLYTDDDCTYQFYEKRGFKRVGERDIEMELNGKRIPLKCLLYHKVVI